MHPCVVEKRVAAVEKVLLSIEVVARLSGQFVFCPVDILEKMVAVASSRVTAQSVGGAEVEFCALGSVHPDKEIARPEVEAVVPLPIERLTLQMFRNIERGNGEYVMV